MTERPDGPTDSDRRHFSRIDFDAHTQLSQGEHEWSVELIDLSLKGLLVATPPDWPANTDLPFAATITLDNGTPIIMSLRWVHSENGHCGFVCEHIDIDSITHLRKLVELNVGDSELLERELAALGKD